MSVGWLKVRQTDYETRRLTKILRNKKLLHMRYLVCLSRHAYFKPKDHQIKGKPHGATILYLIMKNKAANHPP